MMLPLAWGCYSLLMKWLTDSILLLALVGCVSDNLDEAGLPQPSVQLATRGGISLDEMGEGYWVFNRKCMECHEARLPAGETVGQWHPVVKGMSGNAGLSTSEEAAILKYIKVARMK